MQTILFLALLGILCYGGVVGYVCYCEMNVPAPTGGEQAIVVLGAQVLPDGTPNVQLEYRLKLAAEEYQKKARPIVVCGAQGSNECEPEAVSMKRWLTEHGVPESDVYTEPDSFNTNENLRNAKAILDAMNVSSILVVTSDYHLPRAIAIAKDEGFAQVGGAGSPIKREYWLKNHAREALAWGKYWLNKVF